MDDNMKKLKAAADNLKEIIHLETEPTSQDTDPNKVLAAAYGKVNEVVIAGTNKDGEFWFSSSVADGGTVMWLVTHLLAQLMGIKTGNGNTEE